MANLIYRPATAADQKTIQAIIREAEINPLGLKWQNFLVAEEDGQIVATGQIKSHSDGSRELASIATRPTHQRRGLASEIVHRLMRQYAQQTREPLYLFCGSHNITFYERFGFVEIKRPNMPPYFKRISQLASLLEAFAREGQRLAVMKWENATGPES